MTNTKTTKRALLSSVMALILCFAMLIGTTYAWFTDSVTSANNIIKAGNLDIELYNALEIDESKQVGAETKLFDEITYWEPGVVAFENLTVANHGSLALKYQLSVNFTNATENANGETLAEVLKVGFVESGITGTTREEALAQVTTWLPLKSFMQYGELKAVEGNTVDTDTYGIVIYWEPSANDNDFMNLEITLGVNLLATQLTAESDSFGNDYDEDAWVEGWQVYTASDLQTAINNGETDITLMDDIDVTDTLSVPAGSTINLNGNTLSAEWIVTEGAASVVNGTIALPTDSYVYSDITLENVVIDSDNLSVMAYTGGTITLKDVTFKTTSTSNPLQNYGGTLNLENVTVSQEGDANTAWYSSALQVVNEIAKNDDGKWDIISQASTTINGGNYTGKKALMISAPGGNVTINGGTFVGSEYAIQDDFAPKNYPSGANYESVVTINGGTFEGALKISSATELTIYGGTFTVDPSAYVTTGYSVIANADGTYTVVKGESVISSSTELSEALTAGATSVYVSEDMTITTLSGASTLEIVTSADATVTLNSGVAASKDITISGDGTVELVNTNPGYEGKLSYQDGANLTFVGVTFDASNISGICARGGEVKFIDCTITGELKQTIADKFVFTGCTITDGVTQVGYGCSDVVFEDCTFETDGYGIKIYNETKGAHIDLTVTDCSFKNTGDSAKPAILLDHIIDGITYNIAVEGCEFEGFEATPEPNYNKYAKRMIVTDSCVKAGDQYVFAYQTGVESGNYYKILTAGQLVVTVK